MEGKKHLFHITILDLLLNLLFNGSLRILGGEMTFWWGTLDSPGGVRLLLLLKNSAEVLAIKWQSKQHRLTLSVLLPLFTKLLLQKFASLLRSKTEAHRTTMSDPQPLQFNDFFSDFFYWVC